MRAVDGRIGEAWAGTVPDGSHINVVVAQRGSPTAAAAAGVPHLVYTSYYGAAADATFTHGRLHAATEDHIRASGVPFTFLRDNLYLDFLPDLAGADGVIRGPGGSGAVSAVG